MEEVKDVLSINISKKTDIVSLEKIKKNFQKKYPMFTVIVMNLLESDTIEIKRHKIN